jgi:hypothetical protein
LWSSDRHCPARCPIRSGLCRYPAKPSTDSPEEPRVRVKQTAREPELWKSGPTIRPERVAEAPEIGVSRPPRRDSVVGSHMRCIGSAPAR